jgi:hypothetical protein
VRPVEVSSRGSDLVPTGSAGFAFFGPRSGPPSMPKAIAGGVQRY